MFGWGKQPLVFPNFRNPGIGIVGGRPQGDTPKFPRVRNSKKAGLKKVFPHFGALDSGFFIKNRFPWKPFGFLMEFPGSKILVEQRFRPLIKKPWVVGGHILGGVEPPNFVSGGTRLV